MVAILITGAAVVLAGLALAWRVARRKNLDVIARSALHARRARTGGDTPTGTRHLFVSIVDHYEPFWRNRDPVRALERVQLWRTRYPEIASRHRDNGGNPPRHGFFYPEEEYALDPRCMDLLAEIEHAGFGAVEVHLHHDRDTAPALRDRLLAFTGILRTRHGLLRDDPNGGPVPYAFIHGNWVLGNSGPGGAHCGVDNELVVLRETGCYADFTFPSAPHPSQPPVANRIYYPAGDPAQPRAHHRARDARVGVSGGDDLLLITGPLVVNWARRRKGLVPAIENGDLTGLNPPSPDRVDAWVGAGIGVAGHPDWVFVKAHTHGTQEKNSARLLGEGPGSLDALFTDLLARYNDGERWVLHFSTPWEMARAVRVLESADAESMRAVEQFRYRF